MVSNKKGLRNYEIKDSIEAGLVLTGAEVKSVRDNRINISDAFVKVMNNELWLINADISKYKYSNLEKYDSTKSRKLLVHREELNWLNSKSKQGGLTIIPTKVYFKNGRVKVLISLARGRKSYEKKAKEKERILDRELHRENRKYMV